MKTLKQMSILAVLSTSLTSCISELYFDDDYIVESSYNTDQVLQSFDLWYIDIHATTGYGEVPFLQKAFTITFDHGKFLANNNIVGIGKTGGGLGIQVGTYEPLNAAVEIAHDADGLWALEIYVIDAYTLELVDISTDTSYILKGYQQNNFDYDMVFYENIHYFLQEYDVWEKSFTSEEGALNEFDDENYLQFLAGNDGDYFRSSVDDVGTSIGSIQWDFEGDYEIYDVANDATLKTLTLDYDFMGDDYFELYVINDGTIELYHPDSGTIYEFGGLGFIQYLKASNTAGSKKRKKQKNPVMNVSRKRKR